MGWKCLNRKGVGGNGNKKVYGGGLTKMKGAVKSHTEVYSFLTLFKNTRKKFEGRYPALLDNASSRSCKILRM